METERGLVDWAISGLGYKRTLSKELLKIPGLSSSR